MRVDFSNEAIAKMSSFRDRFSIFNCPFPCVYEFPRRRRDEPENGSLRHLSAFGKSGELPSPQNGDNGAFVYSSTNVCSVPAGTSASVANGFYPTPPS